MWLCNASRPLDVPLKQSVLATGLLDPTFVTGLLFEPKHFLGDKSIFVFSVY